MIDISWKSPAGFPANVRQHTGDWVLRRFLPSLSLSVQMSKNLLQLCKQLFGQHYQFPGEVCCFLLWRFSFLGLSLHLLFMIWEIGIKSCTITYNTENLFLCMVRLGLGLYPVGRFTDFVFPTLVIAISIQTLLVGSSRIQTQVGISCSQEVGSCPTKTGQLALVSSTRGFTTSATASARNQNVRRHCSVPIVVMSPARQSSRSLNVAE